MTTPCCACADTIALQTQAHPAADRRETGGWLAAAVALMAALVAGLAALSSVVGPVCEPYQARAPKADAAYADALTARDWKAAIASESRLGLAPGRVRSAC